MTQNHRIDPSWFIIIDREPSGGRFAEALRQANLRVDLCLSVQSAMRLLQDPPERPAVIILEVWVQEGLSLRLLPNLRSVTPLTRFLVITAYGSIASAVQAMLLGAENYLCKPVSTDTLMRVLGGAQALDCSEQPVYPSLDRAIWEYIHFVLMEEGTLAGAARRLGLHARSLRRMLQKFPPAR